MLISEANLNLHLVRLNVGSHSTSNDKSTKIHQRGPCFKGIYHFKVRVQWNTQLNKVQSLSLTFCLQLLNHIVNRDSFLSNQLKWSLKIYQFSCSDCPCRCNYIKILRFNDSKLKLNTIADYVTFKKSFLFNTRFFLLFQVLLYRPTQQTTA